MSNIITIFKKEFRSYFNSPIAYIFAAVFLVAVNWLFWQRFFLINQASMRSFFSLLPWVFLFLLPALSMRLWSEEKRAQTIELLFTLPLRDIEVVIAKYLSSLAFLVLCLGLTLPIVITVGSLGNLDAGQVIGGYLGAFLIGACYLSLGLFLSSLTKNQIVAFLLNVVFCFVLIIIGQDYVLLPFSGFLAQILNFFSLSSHFNIISKGLIDFRDVLYFLSFVGFFVWLNIKSLESRFYKS